MRQILNFVDVSLVLRSNSKFMSVAVGQTSAVRLAWARRGAAALDCIEGGREKKRKTFGLFDPLGSLRGKPRKFRPSF